MAHLLKITAQHVIVTEYFKSRNKKEQYKLKEYQATCNTCQSKVYFYSDKKLKSGKVVDELLCINCKTAGKCTVD
jgi:hypothetical protein